MLVVILLILLTIAAVFMIGAVALMLVPPFIVAAALAHAFGEDVGKVAYPVAFIAGIAMWWYIDEQDQVPDGILAAWWGLLIAIALYVLFMDRLQRTRVLWQSITTAVLLGGCGVCIALAVHATQQQTAFRQVVAAAAAVEAQFKGFEDRPCVEVTPLCESIGQRAEAQQLLVVEQERASSYSIAAVILGAASIWPAIGVARTLASARRPEIGLLAEKRAVLQ